LVCFLASFFFQELVNDTEWVLLGDSAYIAEKEMADKIAPVSLGQGQGPKASLLIADAMATGK
jgi:hypothetical protein